MLSYSSYYLCNGSFGPNLVNKSQGDGHAVPEFHILHFHFLRHFPKRNNYIFSRFGKDMDAERKMLSSESICLSKKAKGEDES